jgi:hypothetical protein
VLRRLSAAPHLREVLPVAARHNRSLR